MKKRLVLVLIVVLLLICGVVETWGADQVPKSIQDGIDEVAQKYGSPQQFMNEVFAGRNRARPVVYPTRTKFVWVVDNEGWPRQTYQPGRIAGWEYIADFGSRQIAFFYPADGSFLFGIPDRPFTTRVKQSVEKMQVSTAMSIATSIKDVERPKQVRATVKPPQSPTSQKDLPTTDPDPFQGKYKWNGKYEE